MDLQDFWEKALRGTEVVRPRIQPLQTFAATHLPYIFLAESSLNVGDTVVRKGEVLVDKPALLLPSDMPLFEGLGFEQYSRLENDLLTSFLLLRGVRFPSLKYQNKIHTLDLCEGSLKKAIGHYSEQLQREENVSTGLVIGPEDCWQFSLLIFICMQVQKSADGDIQRLLEQYKKRKD